MTAAGRFEDEYYRLYRECFPEDGEECADYLFSRRLDGADRRGLFEDGELRSALWLVEKPLFYRGRVLKIPHVVGLCTSPRFRGRGCAKRLLSETLSSLKDVPFVTLYPFKHEFYEKLGFATVSFDFDPPAAAKSGADVRALNTLYGNFCRNLDYYFIRSERDFGFYEEVNRVCGESYSLLDGGKQGFSCPDEYIPRSFYPAVKRGVMARIADLRAALIASGATAAGTVAVADGLVTENNISFDLKDGAILPPSGSPAAVPIGLLTAALFGKCPKLKGAFPELNGYLADRY